MICLSFEYRKEQKMFSTPQSKAFFSQEIVKGKLIAEELQLINTVYDRIWESKNMIAQVIKLLWQPEQKPEMVEEKLKKALEIIQYTLQVVGESNEQFMFEVSLRSDIKHLEHAFFKNMMMEYEQKIKELKHCLLVLQNEVQSLEQKGLLPYVENPDKNNILATKTKYYQEYRQKIKTMNEIVQTQKLSKVVVGLVHTILHNKEDSRLNTHQVDDKQNKNPVEHLDKSYEIKDTPGQTVTTDKKLELTKQQSNKKKQEYSGITEMLKILQNWSILNNFKLKKYSRQYKQKIDALSNCNKTLKQGIRKYKRIMGYEQNQAMVRSGHIELTREQAIDFLHQMNDDLQCRFSRRNIYMIISLQPKIKQTKSCTQIPILHEQKTCQEKEQYFKDLNTNLNNSFLDQCSYLISDRFVAEEDQNQQLIV